MRYRPDLEWVKSKPRRGGFGTFTGILEVVDTNGIVKVSTAYENGKPVIEGGSSTGRVQDICTSYLTVEWTEVCVEGYGCSISQP